MNLGLSGKKVLVTGSTIGIGFATARALAAEGAHVTVNGRDSARVAAAVERLRRASPADAVIDGVAADLSTGAGCQALIARVPAVDVLVNNMGIFEPKPFEQITDEDWLRFFETNVLSGIRLARHYVGGMRTRNWGRIVFISSESALQIPAEMIHYGMTKTAQLAVARGLAETLAGTGVTVNSVLPGPTSLRGRGDLRRPDGGSPRRRRRHRRARVLRHRPPLVAAAALRHPRRGRRDGRLRVQRPGLGDHRRRAAGRRRRGPGHRLGFPLSTIGCRSAAGAGTRPTERAC